MRAGKLDRRVTIMYRPGGDGELTRRLEVWAEWRPLATMRKVEAHALVDGLEGQLRIRDTPSARAITQTDRALFSSQDFEVLNTPVPDRSGYLFLRVGRGT